MIKVVFLLISFYAVSLAIPIVNRNRPLSIQISDDLESAASVYQSHIYPSTYTGINGVPSVPVVPAAQVGYPLGYTGGLNTVYVQPPGYYNPHTGQIAGNVGTYPLGLNGYANSYGWRH
ncbi:hypothetical protein HHI36_007671 [Cryptolaemus montrouzieri]|uniref:Uncharacterized protein n=1 Tax=Cryptolaemus montrouzieri TaxID=559131 RepID=A0ABD2MQ82_9CUCU